MPQVAFLIGGMQKAGTSALARYLRAHPSLRLPAGKEAHVFDMPAFDDTWSTADIDALYVPHLAAGASGYLCGDATPIYAFHPTLVRRIARYNPGMRWILLLRDPAERALSHYHMEKDRGAESWPLWPALLLERWRLRGHLHDFSTESPLRSHSYLARGDYARQLDDLYLHFPREQVLLLRSTGLESDPAGTVAAACAFLGVPPLAVSAPAERVFAGSYASYPPQGLTMRLARWLLRRPLSDLRQRYGIAFP